MVLSPPLACSRSTPGDTDESSNATTEASEGSDEGPLSDTSSGIHTVTGMSSESGGAVCGDGHCEDGEACADDCPPAVCGDGFMVAGEACDDGNTVDGDGCDAECTVTPGWPCGDGLCRNGEDGGTCYVDCGSCGDGVRGGPEQCDDGPDNADGGACRPGCIASRCGDGVVHAAEEECDDGNVNQNDECVHCAWNCACGDGDLCGLEECDEGTKNGQDAACQPDCIASYCGDGHRWAGKEECDDGEKLHDDDDCSNDCDRPRIVFMTSDSYGGNLGGVVGADTKCNTLAANGAASLKGRTFKAWITGAQENTSPWVRIRDPNLSGWYKLVNGDKVGRGWAGLTDGSLDGEIVRDENGELTNASGVWTNTKSDGLRAETVHCSDWSSPDPDGKGVFGAASLGEPGPQWTYYDTSTCAGGKRLYCFEVAY